MKYTYYLLIVFINIVINPILSQSAKQYGKLTVDNGLANMITRGIAQTSNKLIWFATYSGIQSFDGYSYKTYKVQDMDGSIYYDNRFISIVSIGNTVFAATSSNVFMYNERLDTFNSIIPNNESHIKSLNIINDRLFIITNKGYFVYSINGKNSSFYEKHQCTSITNINDNIYLTTNDGIYKLSNNNYNISEYVLNDRNISYSGYCNNQLFCQEYNGQIFLLSDNAKITYNEKLNKIISGKPVRDITTYGGQIIIAVDGLGLIYTDKDCSSFYIDKPNSNIDYSLSIDGIYDLFTDCFDNLWIATFSGGINYIAKNSNGFKHIRHEINNINSISNNNIRAIKEDINSNIWFGHKNGLSIYNSIVNKWIHKDNFASNTVLAIEEDKNSNMWVSAFSSGIIILDNKLNIIKEINTNNSLLSSNDIFVLHCDDNYNMWVSGENGCISRINTKNYQIKTFKIDNVLRAIIEYNKEELIVCGNSGVGIIEKNSGNYKKIYPNEDSKLKSSMYYTVAKDENGNLYVGTEGTGIIIINKNGELISHIGINEGLISDVIYGIETDNKHNLWISTDRGVTKINLDKKSISNYTQRTGLKYSNFMYCSHTELSNGNILFGGAEGALCINPEYIIENKESQAVLLDELYVNNTKIFPGKGNTINSSINFLDQINLKYNENTFSITYRAVDPIETSISKYEWILEGYDKEWCRSTSYRNIYYENIPFGNYKLKIRNSEKKILKSIDINISSPWWFTWWAYLIYTFIIIGCFYILYKFIKDKIERKINRNKIKLFANLAHDIKTPLSVIRLLLSNLKNSLNNDQTTALEIIDKAKNKSDEITSIVNKLIEIEKFTNSNLPMKIAKYRIEASIQGFASAFETLAKNKNISIKYNFPDTPTWAWFDMTLLQRVIHNILDNALKYTPENGEIIISTEIQPNFCEIKITDTGIGIPKKEQKKILKGYFRASNAISSKESGTGVGLILIKEIIKQMKGDISFTSVEGKGTTFNIYLPIGNKHISDNDVIIHSISDVNKSSDRNIKVLLVEDNIELQNIIKDSLGDLYSIYTADNGIQAIDIIKQNIPSIIVTDYMMPEMNGMQLIKHLKSNKDFNNIPIIMLTALSSNEYKIEGYQAGVDAFIEKPFDIDILISRIENLLNHKEIINNEEDKKFSNEEENHLINVFKSYVMEQLSDSELSVEEISKLMGVGYTTLYRKIKTITGNSPIDIINDIRLQKADEYLSSGKYSISQVGYMTGFTSPSYFTKVYKKKYGITPSNKYNNN